MRYKPLLTVLWPAYWTFSALKLVMLLQFAHILTSVKSEGNSKRSYKKNQRGIPFRTERQLNLIMKGS